MDPREGRSAVGEALAQVMAHRLRHAGLAGLSRARAVVIPAEGEQAAVLQLRNCSVQACDVAARVHPGLAVVGAEVDRGAGGLG